MGHSFREGSMFDHHQNPFHAIPSAEYNESVFQLLVEYRRDATADKIDLMVGVYKTDEGTIYTLPSVVEVLLSHSSYAQLSFLMFVPTG